ncbi:flagellar basal body rod modification protein [Pandoraea vervacti]|jgi:flagellar basal-body rod modification protein FlgD|uniref:Basal-body rod modification protein FlgD n=2 Tax=Pandoraea TaxID=93217 RepID=A0A5E5ABX9_9BURK|nr:MULTISPECIES: flagellar hook assembly protein FlgD [Pandoraea]AJP59191.1 flagellar basal body rod modification protein [Pandoraea vervacti]VVE70607.1 flagellar basal body rod modification protein [Pandoraea captiosa]
MASINTSNAANFSQNFLDSINGTANSSSSKSSAGSADDLQNSFLKLLVAQMNNQDPLNPMDNSQVTSQLAQISTVSGITQLNTTLSSVTSQLNSTQSLQAAALVGKGVLIPGTNIGVGSTKADDGTVTKTATPFGFELPSDADTVKIEIKDSTGKTIRTVNAGALDAGVQALTWDAKDDAGVDVADGKYTLSVTATANGKAITPTLLSYAQVQSVVASTTGSPLLNVGTGSNIKLSDVREIL